MGKKKKKGQLLSSVDPTHPLSMASSLHCPFISPHHPKLSTFPSSLHIKPTKIQSSPTSYPSIKAVELDQNTLIAISVGVASVAVGIGIPVFYETQIDNAAKRDNTQPCFPCDGSGSQKCRFCTGTGSVTVEIGSGETEVSRCINCEGAGTLTCTTCQGTGIQPRYLDRREFKDDD